MKGNYEKLLNLRNFVEHEVNKAIMECEEKLKKEDAFDTIVQCGMKILKCQILTNIYERFEFKDIEKELTDIVNGEK